MAKAYLEDPERIVAIGGVVRIANSCVIEDGRLIEVNLPDNALARFQVLEYIRAFLIGRIAWSGINGLMLISGAFGLFKRSVVIDVGGYNHSTVGEDMELVVRIRRKLYEWKKKARIIYIPDPLCWTEAPPSHEILARQRNRWTRGTIETLWRHRKMFLNPRYGVMGMISFPCWTFFEFLAPWVEFSGLLFFTGLMITGQINWSFTVSLLLFVYLFSLFISVIVLLAEEVSFFKYTKGNDFYRMLLTAVVEPFLYHPRVVIWAIKGNISKWKGQTGWGEMSRVGFVKAKSPGSD